MTDPANRALAMTTTSGDRLALQRLLSNPAFGETDQVLIERHITPAVRATLPQALAAAEAQLYPPPIDVVLKALVAAVALVMPAGFSEADKKLWLASARQALKELPADLLEKGIRHARLVADHPSKVVPEIMKCVGAEWRRRQAHKASIIRFMAQAPVAVPTAGKPTPFSHDEIRNMAPELRRVALGRGWLTQQEIDLAVGEEELLSGADEKAAG